MRFGPRETGLLLLLGSMWGLSFLFIEVALSAVEPIWIVVSRVFVGAVVLLVLLALRGGHLPGDLTTWRHLAILGILNNAVPWTAAAWAQQSLPSGLTALLMAMIPTSTLVVSVVVRIERFTILRLAGLMVALGGVAVIVLEDLESGRLLAMGVLLAATFLYATGAVYAKRTVSGRIPTLTLATGQVLSAFILWLPVALLVSPMPGRDALVLPVIGSLLALGALGTGLAFLVFYILVEKVGATNATMVGYLIPVVAVLAGALFLDERLSLYALSGGLLVGLGIFLTQRGTPKSPEEAFERVHR